MSYYPERDIHISDVVKIVSELSNFATKNELTNVTGVDTSNLVAKSDFITLKA